MGASVTFSTGFHLLSYYVNETTSISMFLGRLLYWKGFLGETAMTFTGKKMFSNVRTYKYKQDKLDKLDLSAEGKRKKLYDEERLLTHKWSKLKP